MTDNEGKDKYSYLRLQTTRMPGIYKYTLKREQLKNGKTKKYMYAVRFRDSSGKQQQVRGIHTFEEAKKLQAELTDQISQGAFIPPNAGKKTIGEYGPHIVELMAGTGKPTHARDTESAWKTHVEPYWKGYQLKDVTYTQVQEWVNSLSDGSCPTCGGTPRSASVVLRALGVLREIFRHAVRDRLIKDNPCEGIKTPRKTPGKRTYLNARQLIKLADCSGEHRGLVLTLGFCGLRIGEARALRVRDINFDKKTMNIGKSMTRVGNGPTYAETEPKTWDRRTIRVPDYVLDALKQDCKGKSPDDFVFTENDGSHIGEPKRTGYGWFKRAIDESGTSPELRIHDLRHTAASIAVSSHATVKVVQRMLGHKSASMTLDTYADLFTEDLEETASKIQSQIDGALGEEK